MRSRWDRVGFATLAGSRRYISPGNALLFLIDHALPARLKIWADAEVSEDPVIIEKLAKSRGHTPATHLAFLFHVRAFGWNSEKHTVQRSAREVRSTEPVRPGKADPIQRRRCIEQKQRFFSPTCLERGITQFGTLDALKHLKYSVNVQRPKAQLSTPNVQFQRALH